MGLLSKIRDKWTQRKARQEADPSALRRRTHTRPTEAPVASMSQARNRAERRFFEHAMRRHIGRLSMRAAGKKQARRRVARWQVRLMRELGGSHWAAKPGRVRP